jgi:hypothetical protein
MVQTIRQWATVFCIGLGLFSVAAVASAETVDDPTFTSVAVELSSTTPGDSDVTVDFTFTTDDAIQVVDAPDTGQSSVRVLTSEGMWIETSGGVIRPDCRTRSGDEC